jgi:alpha-glucosidase
MADYTAGGDKLNMAYGFKLLTDEFRAGRFREVVAEFERRSRAGGGYACWSFSNHDCVRVVTRWGRGYEDPAFAKVLLAVLGSLRGSFCIYQGEELGLPEAKVPYHRLTDPYGISFWPDFKGRDGCRTPIPWDGQAVHGGFSTSEPWLPLPPEHLPKSVAAQLGDPDSVLQFYWRFLPWRRAQPALRLGSIRFLPAPDPLLVLERKHQGETLIAVFNLGPEPAEYTLPAHTQPLTGHGLHGAQTESRSLRLPAWGGFFGRLG